MKMSKFALAVFVTFIFLTATIDAYGMRCNHRIVSEGNSLDEVFGLCGEPATKENIQLEYISRHNSGIENVSYVDKEFWVYAARSGSSSKLLTFIGGKLEKIDDGRYGEHPGGRKSCFGHNSILKRGDNIAYVSYICGNADRKQTIGRSKNVVGSSSNTLNLASHTIVEWEYNDMSDDGEVIFKFINGILEKIYTK